MLAQEVNKFARALTNPGLTMNEVCRFLVLETFSRWKPSAAYTGEITEDGHIARVGVFGLPAEVVRDWGNIPLIAEAPLSEAVRTNQIVLLRREEAAERYPILANYDGIPQMWSSYLVCPTLPFGVFALTLNTVPELDEESDLLLRTIGSLVSLYLSRNVSEVASPKRKNRTRHASGTGELSERQMIIKELMKKGYTNTAIAKEIGYSESLVRQETMAIYSILHISGRKDLLDK